MSGGKGGSQTSKVEIPKWIEDPAIRNIGRAEQVAKMGYQPYYGPEVAAFSPMQEQAMQSQYDAAAAFGMAPMGGDAMAGMPTPTEFAGGVRGYGSGDIFEQSVNEFQKRQPDQAAIYNQQFVGPDVNPINYDNNNNRPVMNGGGGGDMPGGPGGTNPLTNPGGGAGSLGFAGGGFNPGGPGGMPGGMPIDYTTGQPFNPGNMTGPFVAQGMGSQLPGSSMIGGSNSGSSDPFDPFTTGRGGVSGTPVDFPKGETVAPDSSDLMIRNQMLGFNMPQAGMNIPSPGMGFNAPTGAVDPRQMQFGRPVGLFGMMGA